MNLKSRREVQHEQSGNMDFMDVDQVLEVPDKPDRLVGTPCNGDCSGIERQSDASTNNRIASKDYINGRMRNQPREKGKSVTVNGSRRFSIHPDSCSNPPVPQVGSSCSLKNALPTLDTAKRDKGKAFCNSNVQRSTCKEGGSFADLTQQNGHGHSGSSRVNGSRKGVPSLNGFLEIDSLNRSNKSCKLNNSLKIVPSSDRGEGFGIVVGVHHKAESNASAFMKPSSSSRASQQKRLVRNGCISPHNIAKSKHVAEKHETSSKAKEVCSGSGTVASVSQSSTVDIKALIAEAEDSCRCKGKGVSCHPSLSEDPDARSGHLSHRRSILKKPAAGSIDFSVDAFRFFAESEGWRTTHNCMKERDIEQQKKGMMQRDHRNERDTEHLDESEIVSSQHGCDPSQTVSRHAHKLGINRQREGTISRNTGKRSMPCVNDTAGEPSTSRPKRNKNLLGAVTLDPVSEPNTHCGNNEESSVRALQVEADEMLARELQEQFYNEELTPAAGIDESQMDSHLALIIAMQQNNSSRHAGGRHAHRRQGPSILNVHQHFRPNTSRRPSIRRGLQPQVHTSTRLARLTSRFLPHFRPNTSRRPSSASTPRNSIFPPNMDVDMRMQILETLEAVGDMQLPNDLLQVGREFNEEDYEMLLALDEDNHQHGGATRAQIDNLPQSMVQAENLQECAICLETPTIGETIRHLPCLHRFHKACIDQWLRRKTSCPVCKSSIT